MQVRQRLCRISRLWYDHLPAHVEPLVPTHPHPTPPHPSPLHFSPPTYPTPLTLPRPTHPYPAPLEHTNRGDTPLARYDEKQHFVLIFSLILMRTRGLTERKSPPLPLSYSVSPTHPLPFYVARLFAHILSLLPPRFPPTRSSNASSLLGLPTNGALADIGRDSKQTASTHLTRPLMMSWALFPS